MRAEPHCKSIWILLALLIFTHVACNERPLERPDRATLTGTVLFKGNRLLGGTVWVESIEDVNIGSSGVINSDGTFFVPNVPYGSVRIAFDTTPMQVGNSSRYVAIPEKYSDVHLSGIQTEIYKDRENKIDISLN